MYTSTYKKIDSDWSCSPSSENSEYSRFKVRFEHIMQDQLKQRDTEIGKLDQINESLEKVIRDRETEINTCKNTIKTLCDMIEHKETRFNAQEKDLHDKTNEIAALEKKLENLKFLFGGDKDLLETLTERIEIINGTRDEKESLRKQVELDYVELTKIKQELATATEKLDKYTCVVCMDKNKTNVLLPCMHFALCEGCAKELKTCPLCRSVISGQLVCKLEG